MVKVVITALCQQNKQQTILEYNYYNTLQDFLIKSREHQIVPEMILEYFSTVV